MNRDEMRRRVSAARAGRLATVDERGRPHLVPFVFVLEGDALYSPIDEKPKRSRRLQRVANLERNPNATVLVDHYEEQWPRLWWVRLRGRGRLVEDEAEREHAARLLAEKYPQYGGTPPAEAVIAIEIEDWRGWSYSDSAD